MKTLRTVLAATLFAAGALTTSAQLETAFTYQGRLTDPHGDLDGLYDFIFALYDDAGEQMGDSLTNLAVAVTDGHFVQMLDFGPNSFRRYLVGAHQFVGPGEWLEISVRTNRAKTYQTLAPRQRLTPTPYASTVTGTLPSSAIEGSYTGKVTFGNSSNAFVGKYSGNGANLTNVDAATLGGMPVGDLLNATSNFWMLAGNAATTPGMHFLGTTDNQALELRVNSQHALRLEPHATSPNVVGGVAGNFVKAGIGGAVIAGGGGSGTLHINSVAAHYGVISGGEYNAIQPYADHATISGGESNMIRTNAGHASIGGGEDNTIQTNADHATIAGGYRNSIQTDVRGGTISGGGLNTIQTNADYASIGGGENNTIETNASNATVAGGTANTIEADAPGAAIGGGYVNSVQIKAVAATISGGAHNHIQADANYATVGGGFNNTIQTNADYATIAGGQENTLQAIYATISGGYQNTNEGSAIYATIGGGHANTIQTAAYHAAIGGGQANTILTGATYATIPGGRQNSATNYALAAGRRAKANHTGAFVWADSTDADMTSTSANSVTMRASGGYRFFTGAGSGATLAAGGGSWTSMSDRNTKENLVPVDAQAVLDRVVALPLSTWNYKSQDAAIRHLGPMAQDFKAAFGVGETDTGITGVDADGVALAAIQGLNQKLEAENAEFKLRLERLEQLVRQLTK